MRKYIIVPVLLAVGVGVSLLNILRCRRRGKWGDWGGPRFFIKKKNSAKGLTHRTRCI